MNTENALKSAVGFFVIILLGSITSAILGGAFASLVATISPDFVSSLFGEPSENIARYSFAVGMIWGLFIGAAVSGFACLLASVLMILKVRLEYKKEQEANNGMNADQ